MPNRVYVPLVLTVGLAVIVVLFWLGSESKQLRLGREVVFDFRPRRG